MPAVRPGVGAAAIAACAAVVVTCCSGCTRPQGETPAAGITAVTTSTTTIAGAGVLGNQRRPDESCAGEPAHPELGEGPLRVDSGTDRGEVDVPADPQRIIVLSGDQLDALCALGLQSRIVAAATPAASGGQPSYLGTAIRDLAAVGTRSDPDRTAIANYHPDLILGSSTVQSGQYADLAAIAPTVFTGAPGPDWQQTLRAVGAATGRGEAAGRLIDEFNEQAHQLGEAIDGAHFQASIVQFTPGSVRVYGRENFPQTVLAAVGVDRPVAQRFTDQPYTEINVDGGALNSADLAAADGDIVYVSFDSPEAKAAAPRILNSGAWRRLSASKDNRVFIVNNEVWQSGRGLIAARGMLDDLRWLNAPIN